MHGWKEHTNSSNLVLCLSFGVYRVAELFPFGISHYIIFSEKRITSKKLFLTTISRKRIQIRHNYDHKIVAFIALLPQSRFLKVNHATFLHIKLSIT